MAPSPEAHNPLICALDSDDRSQIMRWTDDLGAVAGHLKVGLQAYTAFGPDLVCEVTAAAPVFLDVKLHDIPNTVAGAATAAADLGVAMLTVHASGGPQMIAAATKAAPDVAILAVTVLTSLDDEILSAVGQRSVTSQVLRLAELAVDAGAAGIVCAGPDIARVRRVVGPHALVVVPGIRPAGTDTHDQARVATPHQALSAGATHIVVGRPITGAADPAAAAQAILSA